MSPNKFFYIILRSGRIFEFPYSTERLALAMTAFKEKNIFVIQGYGAAINGADFVEVLDDKNYADYLSSVQPKEYVLNGVWYNKRGEFVRFSAWKQALKEEEKKKINAPVDQIEETEEQRQRSIAMGRAYLESIRPNKSI